MSTCFKLYYPSLDGISVPVLHFKKGHVRLWHCAEDGPSDSVAQKIQNWACQGEDHPSDCCVNIGTLMQHPFWPVRIKRALTTKGERQQDLPQHWSSPKTTTQTLVLFWCFLDSRKENKTEKGATFLYWRILVWKKNYTIRFPTVDGLSRLTLLGFRHSSKATFLSSR